jgi:hypothetical protein
MSPAGPAPTIAIFGGVEVILGVKILGAEDVRRRSLSLARTKEHMATCLYDDRKVALKLKLMRGLDRRIFGMKIILLRNFSRTYLLHLLGAKPTTRARPR